jgi:integrase
VDLILNFLSEEKGKGLAYNTINGYRSAISAHHQGFGGTPAGQHPLVKQLLMGIYNECPPTPKYTGTWDVEQVLGFIEMMGENRELDDTQLTHKLAMLLALTSAGRASDIQAMELEYMADRTDRIDFTLVAPTKTSKPWKPRPVITIREFNARPRLDPVACLRSYILRTRPWRKTKYQHKLLLGIAAPHNPVVPSTISRWLKKVMEAAGIDVSIYQAHSTRAAATSKAKAAGLSVAEIMERANWTSAGTFQTFYNREDSIDASQFASTVLSANL